MIIKRIIRLSLLIINIIILTTSHTTNSRTHTDPNPNPNTDTPGSTTNIVHFRGFDSSTMLSPMGLGIPPLKIEIVLESDPPKSTMLVGGLGVLIPAHGRQEARAVREFRGVGEEHLGRHYLSNTYKCVYIYIYIYMYRSLSLYTYIYIYIYREREIYVHAYLYLYIYISIYLSIYLSISLYIYIYICMYVCMCIYLYIYVYTHMQVLARSTSGKELSLG